MILKLTYKIRFPLGAEFTIDPKFLFLKRIYTMMKDVICTNKESKCTLCNKNSKCVYYKLSGENFKNYPAICVNRNYMEKKKISKNDELIVTFYCIGIAGQYVDFIKNYFDITNTLEKQYFQKFIIEQNYIENYSNYDGNIKFITPIESIDDIVDSIKYYNNNYNVDFIMPSIKIIEKKYQETRDYNKYIINGNILKYYGYRYEGFVKNYSRIFFEIGLGKNACIGGGKANEN